MTDAPIRELTTQAERRAAVPILRELWSDHDPEAVLQWTADDDYHLFGLFEQDETPTAEGDAEARLVGVAGARVDDFLHHERHAWLYDLVVTEERRGEGLGTQLVDHVEAWARDHDCESVSLASPQRKTDVHEFYADRAYERWGYVVEKRL